ncbi:MAG TPA: DUF309 domain-containing protein [Cyanobacteria bacterium UBA12227]|nr:DUF309 domain-containing protein [Cyanobacteria bacterium UBA12227]HAX89485.1 DUF309 domain-containing protein [Cyanobacteria bacterium UBA11370]HBY78229.1 DUF309 domain-containing protein [Cyanobacteria bacterium UBA11148]
MTNAFLQGIEEFNKEEFYACHDTLEALWMEAVEPDKRFYQGILQIAVACYHLGNLNWRGAVILLGEGIGRLRDYQPVYEGIDVADLMSQCMPLLKVLQQTGQEQVEEVVKQLTTDQANYIGEGGDEGIGLPKILRIDSIDLSRN